MKKIILIILIIIIVLAGIFFTFQKYAGEKSVLNLRDIGEFVGNFIKKIIFPKIPAGSIEIITDKESYKTGEEIFFAVQNKTDETFRIENECPREPLEIYRLENGKWRHLRASSYVKCKGNEVIILNPYELKGASFLPWGNFIFDKPGKYKLKLEIIGFESSFEKEIEIYAQ